MGKLLLASLLAVSACSLPAADTIVRIGPTCPPGYYRNGAYCVPHAASAKQALPRIGDTCPVGHYRNGPYCLKSKQDK
jgi:hypothetical protein